MIRRSKWRSEGRNPFLVFRLSINDKRLNASSACRTAASVRNRRDINDGVEVESCTLETADRLFASRSKSFDLDRDRLDAVGLCLERGVFGSNLGGVGRGLARTLEAGCAGAAPAEDVSIEIRERDDRVVLACMDAHASLGQVALDLLFLPSGPSGRRSCSGSGVFQKGSDRWFVRCFGHNLEKKTWEWRAYLPANWGLRLGKNSATGETCLLLASLGACVAARSLATDRQLLLVPVATPRADVLETLDIERNLAREFTFNEFLFGAHAEPGLICFAHSIRLRVGINVELVENSLGERATDSLDIREGNDNALIAGKNDATDTEHEEREEKN